MTISCHAGGRSFRRRITSDLLGPDGTVDRSSDLRVLNKRQLTDFDVGCETVAPEHFRHRFPGRQSAGPSRYLVLTLLLP